MITSISKNFAIIKINLILLKKGKEEPKGKDDFRPVKTNEWVVQIEDQKVDVDELASKHGFRNMGKVGSLNDFYLFKKLKTKTSSPPLKTCPEIKFHERQIERKRYKREKIVIKDPLWPLQWHLHSTSEVSLNIIDAWSQNVFGRNVTLAIVDDGLEVNNKDLALNYEASGSYDFNGHDSDPSPSTYGIIKQKKNSFFSRKIISKKKK